jgi:hypothetical protein
VSRPVRPTSVEGLPAPICAFCGLPLEEARDDCPARANGRCRP